jgi:hypothetical protein
MVSPDEIAIRTLDGSPEPGFDCGRSDQNAFLYERAWPDQQEQVSVTYLYYVKAFLPRTRQCAWTAFRSGGGSEAWRSAIAT